MKNKFIAIVCALALTASMLFTGCGSIDVDATLATCDGEVVYTLGYGNFVARYMQSIYDSYLISYYGEDIWSQESTDDDGNTITMEESLKSGIIDGFETTYLLYLHADDYGVSLTDEELEEITAAATEFLEENDEDTLDVLTATQEIVEQYLTYQAYEQKMTTAIEDETEITVTEEDAITSTFSYVFIDTTGTTDDDGNEVEYTDEEIEELRAQAEAIATADDYDATAEGYDLTVRSSTFVVADEDSGSLDTSIMEVLRGMTDGEVSDVIEIEDDGFYVVRLDSTNDADETAETLESLIDEEKSAHYDEVVEGWKDEVEWVVDEEAWAQIKFDTLFTIISEDEEE